MIVVLASDDDEDGGGDDDDDNNNTSGRVPFVVPVDAAIEVDRLLLLLLTSLLLPGN